MYFEYKSVYIIHKKKVYFIKTMNIKSDNILIYIKETFWLELYLFFVIVYIIIMNKLIYIKWT